MLVTETVLKQAEMIAGEILGSRGLNQLSRSIIKLLKVLTRRDQYINCDNKHQK